MDWGWLSGIDLRKWWVVIVAGAFMIILASIAVKFVPTILLGLGLLGIGIGEWVNHPANTRILGGFEVTAVSYPRSPSGLGRLFDAGGVVLLAAGLGRLLFA